MGSLFTDPKEVHSWTYQILNFHNYLRMLLRVNVIFTREPERKKVKESSLTQTILTNFIYFFYNTVGLHCMNKFISSC